MIGRTKGGMNSKLHSVTDAAGRPLRIFLTAGQRSDYIGARALLDGLPPAEHMLADRGYDADWYREALENKGITPCIPSRKNRKVPIPHDEARYRKRHKIEKQLRPAQGLAARCNPRRQVPQGLPVGMRLGCCGDVLVMNPDPSPVSEGTNPHKWSFFATSYNSCQSSHSYA